MHTFILEPEDAENNHPAVLVSPAGMSEDAASKTIQAALIKHGLIALEQGEGSAYKFESHVLEELGSLGFIEPEHTVGLPWDEEITDRKAAKAELAKLLKSGALQAGQSVDRSERELIRIPSVTGDPDDYHHVLPPIGMSTAIALATVNKIIIRRGVELRRNDDAGLELQDYCADGRELADGLLMELAQLGFEMPVYARPDAVELQPYDDDVADALSDAYTQDAVPSQLLPFDGLRLQGLGIVWQEVCTQFNLPNKPIEDFHPSDQYKYIADYVKWRHEEEMKDDGGPAP